MDVFEAIKTRRSVRAYSACPIPGVVLERLAQAMRAAPSACNYQPWHFIWVMKEQIRRGIAKAANDKGWLTDAPIIVVACGFPEQAYSRMGGYGNSVDIDVAIAIDHLTLAAVAEGLGTCWTGAFNEARIKELLNIPAAAKVVAMTPLGFPASLDLLYPLADNQRKPLNQILSTDHYAGPPLKTDYPGS